MMQTSPVSGQQQSRNCVYCRRDIPSDANICPYCGYDYRYASGRVGYQASVNVSVPPYYQAQSSATVSAQNASFPMIGGILTLIGGILGILFGIVYLLLSDMISGFDYMGMLGGFQGLMVIYGLIGVIFGLVGMVGAVFAIRKQYWLFSIIGTICVMIGGFSTILPLVFGLVGLILIALSRSEFRS